MIILLFLLVLTSCMSTEVIGYTEPIELADTTTKKPHKPLPPMPPADTTNEDRVPIDWNANVGEWDNIDTN